MNTLYDDEILNDEISNEETQDSIGCACPPVQCIKETKLKANCAIEIHAEPKNMMIYVCPGRKQYFLVTSSKSCGEISTKFLPGTTPCNNVVNGKLGEYIILNSGILFIPKANIVAGDYDVLSFEASDGCAKPYIFNVVFTFDPCKCCAPCKCCDK